MITSTNSQFLIFSVFEKQILKPVESLNVINFFNPTWVSVGLIFFGLGVITYYFSRGTSLTATPNVIVEDPNLTHSLEWHSAVNANGGALCKVPPLDTKTALDLFGFTKPSLYKEKFAKTNASLADSLSLKNPKNFLESDPFCLGGYNPPKVPSLSSSQMTLEGPLSQDVWANYYKEAARFIVDHSCEQSLRDLWSSNPNFFCELFETISGCHQATFVQYLQEGDVAGLDFLFSIQDPDYIAYLELIEKAVSIN